jgi:hypothetical protein
VPSSKPAVAVTEGCAYLAAWACRATDGARTWYLVPSAAGARLFRKSGWQGFQAALAPWARSAGIDAATARVVSALPAEGGSPAWPRLRPDFCAPQRDGDTLRFAFSVPFELAIFRGHFPTVPIVPGALLTGWALELAREHCGWQYGAACASTLKFRRIVQPGLAYALQLVLSAAGRTLEFVIRQDSMDCAMGLLTAPPA